MKRAFLFLLASALILPFISRDIFACTTFCLKNNGEILFGKNYDWMIGDGMIFINKRGVSKISSKEVNPAKWVSKYGSVTFNQYGWESPSGGMNEEGLVIELMWLDDTQYPAVDDRPAVDVLEWIQYNLDTAALTEHVVRNSDAIRISSAIKLHYLVNDRFGNSATIEFLNGKLVAHTGDKLPYSVLTNDTYARSLEHAKKFGSASSEGSLDRFSRAAAKSREFETKGKSEKDAVDYAFDVLNNVAQKNSTQWSIVYDQRRGRIYWRTRKRTDLKSIDTTGLDYSCGTPVKVLDVDTKESGDVTRRLTPYTRQENRELIERSFGGTDFLKKVPNEVRDQLSEFPEKFVCAANSPVTRPIDPRSLIASGQMSGYLFSGLPLYHILALWSH
ncbi:MAG TPA: linear amide C-N hydrolase [Pyrinomonadaceae bacterium]|nr:linear amide C-N hydrolase [Pyrinomonadaceae bacterium]